MSHRLGGSGWHCLVPCEHVSGDRNGGAQALPPPAAAERPHGRYGEGGHPLAGVQQHHAPSAVWFMALLAACGGPSRQQLQERRWSPAKHTHSVK